MEVLIVPKGLEAGMAVEYWDPGGAGAEKSQENPPHVHMLDF